jgi:hypothetical protein
LSVLANDNIRASIAQLFCKRSCLIGTTGGPANFDPNIAAVRPTQLSEPLQERRYVDLSKLLIIEGIYPQCVDQSEASRGAAANDVNMLVCTGGRQRSEAEFRSLYTAGGFVLSRIIPTDMAFASIIEGVRK